MKILFLTSAHNSLSQRLSIELVDRGHAVTVTLATSGDDMVNSVFEHAPDLIIAPMLKSAIPEAIWSRHVCLVVHPGIRGRSRSVLARLGDHDRREDLGGDDPAGRAP